MWGSPSLSKLVSNSPCGRVTVTTSVSTVNVPVPSSKGRLDPAARLRGRRQMQVAVTAEVAGHGGAGAGVDGVPRGWTEGTAVRAEQHADGAVVDVGNHGLVRLVAHRVAVVR